MHYESKQYNTALNKNNIINRMLKQLKLLKYQ